MCQKTRWMLAPLLVGLLASTLPAALTVMNNDTETNLAAKLKRESNPVRKAIIEIQISKLKLQAAKDARGKNNVDESLQSLQDYHGHIQSAWTLLLESGRIAQKKPQGFKELEIALREDERTLEDIERNYSLADREQIDQLLQDIKRIRADVIKALFPAAQTPAP